MKWGHGIDALKYHKLKASDPATFNDPFDCAGTCHGGFGEISRREFGSLKVLQRILFEKQALSDKLRVLSFVNAAVTDLKTEMLLWSHYAENGKGIRVMFEFGCESEFSTTPTKAQEVHYRDEIPSLDLDCYEHDKKDEFYRFLEKCVWTKGTAWSYEHEVRLVAMKKNLQQLPNSPESFCIEFNPKCVKEIVFGPHAPFLEQKHVVKSAVGDEYGDSVRLGWARCDEKKFRYDYLWSP